MPLVDHEIHSHRAWGLWKIEEKEEFLGSLVNEHESIPDSITHSQKRLEFITGRVLIKELLNQLGLPFYGITKNQHGQPFLKQHSHHITLSHSYPYVTALIDEAKLVGIDLEQVKSKLLIIAPRVLHQDELKDAGEDPTKHCIYWCAKETLLKIHGKKNLILAENLLIMPFSLQNKGNLIGRIIANGVETMIPLQYRLINDFVLVSNT